MWDDWNFFFFFFYRLLRTTKKKKKEKKNKKNKNEKQNRKNKTKLKEEEKQEKKKGGGGRGVRSGGCFSRTNTCAASHDGRVYTLMTLGLTASRLLTTRAVAALRVFFHYITNAHKRVER